MLLLPAAPTKGLAGLLFKAKFVRGGREKISQDVLVLKDRIQGHSHTAQCFESSSKRERSPGFVLQREKDIYKIE